MRRPLLFQRCHRLRVSEQYFGVLLGSSPPRGPHQPKLLEAVHEAPTGDCSLNILSSITITAAIWRQSSRGIIKLEKYNYSLYRMKLHFHRLPEGAPENSLMMRLVLLLDSLIQLIVSVKTVVSHELTRCASVHRWKANHSKLREKRHRD